jgi:predicted house-cleaning NTP pyrophosphatase (Maf/HAM1 superfamily)
MLQDLNGSVCEVVTGVSLGELPCTLLAIGGTVLTFISLSFPSPYISWVQYTVGYLSTAFQYIAPDRHSSLEERSLVYFSDNPTGLLKAYVDSGEGLDRAGGFAVQVRSYTQIQCPELSKCEQGLGGLLVRKIEGDYHNVVGFPAASFFRFLDLLVEEDDDFLEI